MANLLSAFTSHLPPSFRAKNEGFSSNVCFCSYSNKYEYIYIYIYRLDKTLEKETFVATCMEKIGKNYHATLGEK